MCDNCLTNSLQDICSSRREGTSGRVKEMEMACSEDRIAARRCDFCISMRSMNSASCEVSIVGWLKNLISISPRRGASILATKLSKYLLVPRYLRHVRAGRTTRSPDCGGKPTKFRRGGRRGNGVKVIEDGSSRTRHSRTLLGKNTQTRNFVELKIYKVLAR
jgi:hypothetical protein